jgi:hypothetical protein
LRSLAPHPGSRCPYRFHNSTHDAGSDGIIRVRAALHGADLAVHEPVGMTPGQAALEMILTLLRVDLINAARRVGD